MIYKQQLAFKLLLITKMINSPHRNAFIQQFQPVNLLMKLKQKKKQMINRQADIQKRIKQYFSDLTIQIYHKQTATLDNFKNKLYQFFQSIDTHTSMPESERNENREQINKILHFQLEIVENKKFKQLLQTNILEICREQQMEMDVTIISSQQQKTNKKGFVNSNVFLKASYAQQISQLQDKIQKLLLKEQKLKMRLGQMDSRHKMKKLGNTYLPYQQKSISSMLLQRLESENKILIEQISDCSQKILSLRSQNSILMKERQNSNILQTEKKKAQSIHVVQESIQFSQYQQKILVLETEIQSMKKEMQNQRKYIELRQQQIVKDKQQSLQELRHKIQELEDYNNRLYKQCQQNISKKIDLQEKLQQQIVKFNSKQKQNENLKQKNNNYIKLVKMKQDKLVQLDIQINKCLIKLKQSEENYKKLYVESSQKIEGKDNIIKSKQQEIQSLKSMIKKQQNEKAQIKQKLSLKQEQIFNQCEKTKIIQSQLNKLNKEKQNHAKKQVKKAKNEIKKSFQDEKKEMIEQFKLKYGQFMEKIQLLKKQVIDNREKCDRKIKIQQNRMSLFKDKVAYQTKQMMQKMSKPGQKERLIEIIQSYIQNQSNLTLKNTQIKMLKDQIGTLKKQNSKKDGVKITYNQSQICSQLQLFQRKLFTEKLQLQQSIHESRMKQQQQQYELLIQQKVLSLQQLVNKCQLYEKNAKFLQNQLKNIHQSANPQMMQLRKNNQQMIQKQKRTQSLINSLKNNLSKSQNQTQQLKQQLKIKKELINGFKKQLKDKDLQKQKLNETINDLISDAQKLKKTSKQANKKQAMFQQFKDKLINQTELSQQILQLKASIQEKQKIYKIQINKKDQTIKQLKQNDQILNKKLKSQTILQEQILDLKQKNRKLKGEIDRKDTLIQHIKQKQQKVTNQAVVATEAIQTDNKKIKKQLQIQKSKFETLKLRQRKLETNYQLLKICLVKIYQKMHEKISITEYTSLQKQYNTLNTDDKKTRYEFTVQKTPEMMDMSRYREGLSILQISGEELDIVNTKSIAPYSPIPNKMPQRTIIASQNANLDISKLTQLLQCQQIDSNPILTLFNYVLDERGTKQN